MKLRKNTTKKIISIAICGLLLTALAMPFIANQALAQDDIWGVSYTTDVGLPDQDLRVVISRIIQALLGFLGIVALVIVLIGGVEWMTAGGSDDKVKTAQKRIGYGVIGIIIIFVAYAITTFVFEVIWNAVNTP